MTMLWLYQKTVDEGITGDKIISHLRDIEARNYFYDHPTMFKVLMVCVMVFIVLLWPCIIWYFYRNNDNK